MNKMYLKLPIFWVLKNDVNLAKNLVQLHKRGRNGNWKVTKEKKKPVLGRYIDFNISAE